MRFTLAGVALDAVGPRLSDGSGAVRRWWPAVVEEVALATVSKPRHDERRRNHPPVEPVETTAALPPGATTRWSSLSRPPQPSRPAQPQLVGLVRKIFEELPESLVDKGFLGLRLSVVTA